MKIVIAPDSFKESLTAIEVADAIEAGFKKVLPHVEYVKIPMADGGEGTVQSLVDATNGRLETLQVTSPLGEPVDAFFGILGDGKTAIIEMSAASGLHLVPRDKRNPLLTTTWGTGELIRAALDRDVSKIIIGLGGSATNDGGAGMAQALGVRLLTHEGGNIGYGGGSLKDLAVIDTSKLDSRLHHVQFEVACDVKNPLLGITGASVVFGPQKGATANMVEVLDSNLAHFAAVIQEQVGKDVKAIPGAGAAGGLGAGLLAFLPAQLTSGVEIVLRAVDFENRVKDADLVITAEGRIDHQSIFGKTPIGIARIAKQFGIPVIGIAGGVSEGSNVVFEHGIDALFSIVPGVVSLQEAFTNAHQYLMETARNIAALWMIRRL